MWLAISAQNRVRKPWTLPRGLDTLLSLSDSLTSLKTQT